MSVIVARLPWLYLIYAVPAIIGLSFAMAPFQVPDELNHAFRAEQISLGTPIPAPFEGWVDENLIRFGSVYEDMWFHPEVKQTVERARQAGEFAWSGALAKKNFQNTIQYGPLLYLPQALSFHLGRAAGLSVAQTLVAARIVNGLAAILAGFIALTICRRGRALMFTTLLLPMTLSEFASLSQDALIIGLSLVAIAVASRVMTERRPATVAEFALYAAVVAATTMARPSQVALIILTPVFLGWPLPRWRAKVVIGACAAVVTAAWIVLLRTLLPPTPKEWSPSGQFEYLATHPLALPTVMLATFAMQAKWLVGTVIGRMGWLDTPMPGWYYWLACVALLLAAVAPGNKAPNLRPAVLAVLTVTALVTATCFALYLSWTPLHKPTIDGLQGRYLLPVLPLIAWVVPSYGPSLERALRVAWYPVVLFPLLTYAVMPGVIVERYYGSWAVLVSSLRALLFM